MVCCVTFSVECGRPFFPKTKRLFFLKKTPINIFFDTKFTQRVRAGSRLELGVGVGLGLGLACKVVFWGIFQNVHSHPTGATRGAH